MDKVRLLTGSASGLGGTLRRLSRRAMALRWQRGPGGTEVPRRLNPAHLVLQRLHSIGWPAGAMGPPLKMQQASVTVTPLGLLDADQGSRESYWIRLAVDLVRPVYWPVVSFVKLPLPLKTIVFATSACMSALPEPE